MNGKKNITGSQIRNEIGKINKIQLLQYFSLYLFEARDKKMINIIKIIVSFLTKLSISPSGNSKNIVVYRASLYKKLILIFFIKLNVKIINVK